MILDPDAFAIGPMQNARNVLCTAQSQLRFLTYNARLLPDLMFYIYDISD